MSVVYGPRGRKYQENHGEFVGELVSVLQRSMKGRASQTDQEEVEEKDWKTWARVSVEEVTVGPKKHCSENTVDKRGDAIEEFCDVRRVDMIELAPVHFGSRGSPDALFVALRGGVGGWWSRW